MSQHTEEQYQLGMDIAAMETIVNYCGPDMSPESVEQFRKLKAAMQTKLKEIGLSVAPEELFNHICARYLTKH